MYTKDEIMEDVKSFEGMTMYHIHADNEPYFLQTYSHFYKDEPRLRTAAEVTERWLHYCKKCCVPKLDVPPADTGIHVYVGACENSPEFELLASFENEADMICRSDEVWHNPRLPEHGSMIIIADRVVQMRFNRNKH